MFKKKHQKSFTLLSYLSADGLGFSTSGRVWVLEKLLFIESIGYYRVLKILIGYFPTLSYLTLGVLGFKHQIWDIIQSIFSVLIVLYIQAMTSTRYSTCTRDFFDYSYPTRKIYYSTE